MKFSIYRYDPDKDEKPYMRDYDVQLAATDKMLLDALLRIKSIDDSLSLRRSCREGVCGSDAMNINGRNGLACITPVNGLKEPVEIRPLPGLPVIRDLIVDMTQFYQQYHSIKPYLINNDPPPETERLQSPEDRAAGFLKQMRSIVPGEDWSHHWQLLETMKLHGKHLSINVTL